MPWPSQIYNHARQPAKSWLVATDKEGRSFHRDDGPFFSLVERHFDREQVLRAWVRAEEVPAPLHDRAAQWIAAFRYKWEWQRFVEFQRYRQCGTARARLSERISDYVNANRAGLGLRANVSAVSGICARLMGGASFDTSKFLRTYDSIDEAKIKEAAIAIVDAMNAASLSRPRRVYPPKPRGKPQRRYDND